MTKIGIIIPHLMASQHSYVLLNYIKQYTMNTTEYDFVIFTEHIVPPCMPVACACINMAEIWNFNGYLIATTLHNAEFMIKAVNSAQKLFYIMDLEWLRNKKNYIRNISIYRHPQIKLIARSESHAKAIYNYCNRKVDGIIQHFNIRDIIHEFCR